MTRLVASVLLLPRIVVALGELFGAISATSGESLKVVLDSRYFALWYCIIFFLAFGLFGLPIRILFVRKRWLNALHSALAGALIGAAVFLLPVFPILLNDKLHLQYRIEQMSRAFNGAGVGLAHGLLFWFLAVWRNASLVDDSKPEPSAA